MASEAELMPALKRVASEEEGVRDDDVEMVGLQIYIEFMIVARGGHQSVTL